MSGDGAGGPSQGGKGGGDNNKNMPLKIRLSLAGCNVRRAARRVDVTLGEDSPHRDVAGSQLK